MPPAAVQWEHREALLWVQDLLANQRRLGHKKGNRQSTKAQSAAVLRAHPTLIATQRCIFGIYTTRAKKKDFMTFEETHNLNISSSAWWQVVNDSQATKKRPYCSVRREPEGSACAILSSGNKHGKYGLLWPNGQRTNTPTPQWRTVFPYGSDKIKTTNPLQTKTKK